MAYGMVAKNDHGVLLSADQKNYVFTGYYPAPAPSGNLFTFNVAATSLSLYGIRLPVGGQGSVISSVAISGGYRVTVIGTSVTGLLVFSPISGGGKTGYGFSMFNSAGACTFDSNQKHLVISSAGALPVGGSVAGTGDVVIFPTAGIYPETNYVDNWITVDHASGTRVVQHYAGTDKYGTPMYNYEYVVYNMYLDLLIRTTNWAVYRPTAVRGGASFSSSKILHSSGWYKQQISYRTRGGSSSSFQPFSYGYMQDSSGALTANSQYPYAASSYNTTQNLALITNSALYL